MNHLDQNAAIPKSHSAAYNVRPSNSIEMPPLNYGNVKLRPRHPTSPISSEASAEDKPIFMASKLTRKHQRSFSPVGNGTKKKAKRLCRSTCQGPRDASRENMASTIINREISDWQDVCQTGRASFFSPSARRMQQGARSSWQEESHADPRRQSVAHSHHPWDRVTEQRRAVTDSYLVDTSDAQDLAHFAAVQLLSACFTIPVDQMSSSAYHCFGTMSAANSPDSRMISSLRMHTDNRYSPSFGHQARNTSPVNIVIGAYDGPSPPIFRTQSLKQPHMDVEDSGARTRKQRIHRALHVTDRSAAECATESHMGRHEDADTRSITAAKTGHDSNHGTEYATASTAPTRNVQSCPASPKHAGPQPSPTGSSPSLDCTIGSSDSNQMEGRPSGLRRWSLRTVIRSDPHHIYVQPVKEIIAKWRVLRRRVGRSLGRSSPHPTSGGATGPSVLQTTLYSTPSETCPGSPIFSSDAKERRRQARQRGYIHSSGESSPCYGIPPLGFGAGCDSAIVPLDEISRAASPLGSWAAISVPTNHLSSNLDSIPDMSLGTKLYCMPLESEASSGTPCPPVVPAIPAESRSESGLMGGSTVTTKQGLSKSSSARLHNRRRQRKSLLSEVYTAEDAEAGQNALKEPGSTLVSPKEESGSEMYENTPGQGQNQPANKVTPRASDSEPTTESSTRDGDPPGPISGHGDYPRQSMVRVSTSGTQVFKPGEDGVEIDGLPVGPVAANWNDERRVNRGKERSYL